MTGTWTGVMALDGPSGTGKSTVARGVARALGARYLDTGAMYRAVTVAVLRAGVVPEDADAVARLVASVRIEIGTDPDAPSVRLAGAPVDAEIRTAATTAAVSAISAVPAVRDRLVARQRDIIRAGAGIVVEGRDIGSVVWPQAAPKVYLTASAEQRARRRAGELAGSSLADVGQALATRDRLDSTRAVSPLVRAPDAVELDTSSLSAEQVVEQLVALARR